MITLLVACSSNGVIGINNELPWRLPEDLKRFKKMTIGKSVVMGRKTFQSIGKPLPNRVNIVMTRGNFDAPGAMVCRSVEDVMDHYNTTSDILSYIGKELDMVVIGGSEIYKQMMPFVERIEMTLIGKEFEGDTFFELDSTWVEKKRETHKNEEFQYQYITYKKEKNGN